MTSAFDGTNFDTCSKISVVTWRYLNRFNAQAYWDTLNQTHEQHLLCWKGSCKRVINMSSTSPNLVAVKDVPNLATGLQGDRGCVYIVPHPRHHVHMADLKAAAPHQPQAAHMNNQQVNWGIKNKMRAAESQFGPLPGLLDSLICSTHLSWN